ncbi:hypothetical protein SMACR_04157 [Sordaria macrospora]|uniref:Putative lipoate-protein ligase A n=2 Tax=Sordaria macrospora TaxID=5147 RepID=F7VZI0_SORMK|nr:uncharacterized protein SMAC_04157 [Sordaria macrospora k-hell]KAA8631201.1 hypothetical protein SMACR_04157 [Sordaria macrospora]KAH7635988.1 hypothetical protein B0T09DRAFT_330202 [Sordaria sp. MPI-SDFR-AT-0083]WPJ64452.1 hypothetical protein SMAC4_04157 [Sordaria macrospora]CCC10928.1 unnamed protein product [Sordaria macrospora k-hell]
MAALLLRSTTGGIRCLTKGPAFISTTTTTTISSRLGFSRLTKLRRSYSTTISQDLLNKKVQVYQSTSNDPYLNLSIEHHLLQHSHPDSYVLFLYINDPCVVIGRNQNPWLEVNLPALQETEDIKLVRRRSGGGTVFHDHGNVNWSVICPPAVFDRDRHAEMVVRALKDLGVTTAKVNERHDIVIAGDGRGNGKDVFKVSGSAYKLTRLRSLHHGTCLLNSPQLKNIGKFLRSPGEPYIKARGVESVRSPIRNVDVDTQEFNKRVVDEFLAMYEEQFGEDVTVERVGEDLKDMSNIRKGMDELTSIPWIYGQTPQFTFSSRPTEDDPRERPPLDLDVQSDFNIEFTLRHGEIQTANVSGLKYEGPATDKDFYDGMISKALAKGSDDESAVKLYEIKDWAAVLKSATAGQGLKVSDSSLNSLSEWLNKVFPGSHFR